VEVAILQHLELGIAVTFEKQAPAACVTAGQGFLEMNTMRNSKVKNG